MDDEVDIAAEGRLEGALEVGDKVVAPAPPLDAGTNRQVEAEMGVGDEEDTNGARLGVVPDAHVPMLDFFSEKQYRERLAGLRCLAISY
jgi:hypothetical protein